MTEIKLKDLKPFVQMMRKIAINARKFATSFPTPGCCVSTEKGDCFGGSKHNLANYEFILESRKISAEETAILRMLSTKKDIKISGVYIYCEGDYVLSQKNSTTLLRYCRQNTPIYIDNGDRKVVKVYRIEDLLPYYLRLK